MIEPIAVVIATAAPNMSAAQIVFANDACAALFDAPVDSLLGRGLIALCGVRPDRALLRAFEHAWTGRATRAEVIVRSKSGDTRALAVDVAPLRDDRGAVARYAIVARDVTAPQREASKRTPTAKGTCAS